MLVFRDQDIIPEDHKRFAGLFGELHPVALAAEDSDPYILEISASKESREVAGNGWHADGTADEEPSLGSMLRITRIAEAGSGPGVRLGWASTRIYEERLFRLAVDVCDVRLPVVHRFR